MRYVLRPPHNFAFLVVSALFVSATLTWGAPQNSPFDLSGTIHDASRDKFTVDSGQGIFFHVVYDDKTVIVGADGTSGSAENLKVGAKVHVIGDLSETGQVNATRIEMLDEKKKEPAANSGLPEIGPALAASKV